MASRVTVPNPKTLAMYRRMLKSLSVVFRGDYEMFHKSRLEIKRSIQSFATETDPLKVNKLIFDFEEGRRALENQIMQGNLQPDGTYRWKVRKEHAMGAQVKTLSPGVKPGAAMGPGDSL